MKKPRKVNPRAMSERMWVMHESGMSTADIAAQFGMIKFQVSSTLATIRKRKRRDAARAEQGART